MFSKLANTLPRIFGSSNQSTTTSTNIIKMPRKNVAVPGADQYYPLNTPEIGAAYPDTNVYPQNKDLPVLFQPLTIKNVTFKNRIFVSPMCQYSADDGHLTDWHFVHLGGFATRGTGAICIEATSVVPEGRISPQDSGLWTDSQIEPLQRIVKFSHAHGTKIGIQLAHAGRKASTLAPWVRSDIDKPWAAHTYVAGEEDDGWPDNVWAPSEIQFSSSYPKPKAATEEYLRIVEDAFLSSVERCKKIGFDFIEIHAAHGYLLHEFLSPLSNKRTDQWGGQPLENRLRFLLRVVEKVRAAWDGPLFVRISATDWAEGPERDEATGEWKQWGIEQSKILVAELIKLGVDFLDVSGGGNWQKQKIPIAPGYQTGFAEEIKKAYPNLLVGTVGLITDPHQAESYLSSGRADAVLLARELLRNPHWAMTAASELGVAVKLANQYERAWTSIWVPAKKGETEKGRGEEQPLK